MANSEGAWAMTALSGGGYALAGGTASFGAGSSDILLLKLGLDGFYPGCVTACYPFVNPVTPDTGTLVSLGISCPTPNPAPYNVISVTPQLTLTDVCQPLGNWEGNGLARQGITCSPVPGGALFVSPGDLALRIYAVDGRIICSGELRRGENRIGLDRGVYFWMADDVGAGPRACPSYMGKVAIR